MLLFFHIKKNEIAWQKLKNKSTHSSFKYAACRKKKYLLRESNGVFRIIICYKLHIRRIPSLLKDISHQDTNTLLSQMIISKTHEERGE